MDGVQGKLVPQRQWQQGADYFLTGSCVLHDAVAVSLILFLVMSCYASVPSFQPNFKLCIYVRMVVFDRQRGKKTNLTGYSIGSVNLDLVEGKNMIIITNIVNRCNFFL